MFLPMPNRIARREFLKSASLAAGALGVAAHAQSRGTPTTPKPGDVRISAAKYQPVADYPIQPKRYSEVTLKDQFWSPKVLTNADVTIPFEVEKRSPPRAERVLSGVSSTATSRVPSGTP